MKTSLSLACLTVLSASAFLACDGGGTDGPVPVTGGTTSTGGGDPGTGGVTPGVGGTGATGTGGAGAAGSGGDAGTGGSGATSGNLLFDGVGTWIAMTGNTVMIQGAFYILEDSVKDDVAVADTLTHSDLNADTGGTNEDGVSKFDDLTEKPCISGTVTQVTDEMGMTGCNASAAETEAGACQWSAQWGGGIGLNLSETGGDDSVKSTWDGLANGVAGFTFTPSGDAGGATLRVKIKNAGSDEDFCKAFTIVPGMPITVAWADFKHKCWGTDGDQVPNLNAIESLQWQVVSSQSMGYTVANFCIENLSWF